MRGLVRISYRKGNSVKRSCHSVNRRTLEAEKLQDSTENQHQELRNAWPATGIQNPEPRNLSNETHSCPGPRPQTP